MKQKKQHVRTSVKPHKDQNSIGLKIGAIFISIIVICFSVIIYSFYWYLNVFIRESGTTPQQMRQAVKNVKFGAFSSADSVTFLVLGMDKRNDSFENTSLTDGMMILRYRFGTNSLSVLSIPRDVWIQDLGVKVNALYKIGLEKRDGFGYISEQLFRLFEIRPDKIIVLTYADLPHIIDTIGGIDVMVPRSFTDNRFPNADYIASIAGSPVYITIMFQEGIQRMDGNTALQYMRSRMSTDPVAGTDTDRQKRESLVLEAVMTKLMRKESLLSPSHMGKIYSAWKTLVTTNMTDTEILNILFSIRTIQVPVISHITIPSTESPRGALLVHPPEWKYGAWVWEVENNNMDAIKTFVQKNL